jgi:hypothetical protein
LLQFRDSFPRRFPLPILFRSGARMLSCLGQLALGVLYLFLTVIVCGIATNRGRDSLNWLLIALFLTPPIALILLFRLKDYSSFKTFLCPGPPVVADEPEEEEILCNYCRTSLEDPLPSACPQCGAPYRPQQVVLKIESPAGQAALFELCGELHSAFKGQNRAWLSPNIPLTKVAKLAFFFGLPVEEKMILAIDLSQSNLDVGFIVTCEGLYFRNGNGKRAHLNWPTFLRGPIVLRGSTLTLAEGIAVNLAPTSNPEYTMGFFSELQKLFRAT